MYEKKMQTNKKKGKEMRIGVPYFTEYDLF
jgi:hypothetical protein